jgi:orotate phosphoribosyltransferase-like protein
MFAFDESTDNFILKFTRRHILPQTRKRLVGEFEYELDRANITRTRYDINRRQIHYWYYDLNKLLTAGNPRYISKLQLILSELLDTFEYDMIAIFDDRVGDEFPDFVKRIADDKFKPIVKVSQLLQPRLFPYSKIHANSNIIVFVDTITNGIRLETILTVLKEHCANVTGIITLVCNEQKLSDFPYYIWKKQRIPLFYFLSRSLENEGQQDSANNEEKDKTYSVRSSRDFLFFWEIIQLEGNISEQHYITSTRDVGDHDYNVHFDWLFDLQIDSESLLARDLAGKFKARFGHANYASIIANTSKYAFKIASVINSNLEKPTSIISHDFSKKELPFTLSDSETVLLVDDAANSWWTIRNMIQLLKDNGFCQKQIHVYVAISRLNISLDTMAEANRRMVEYNSELFVYYSCRVPFYVMKESDEHISCPKCYLEKMYRDQLAHFERLPRVKFLKRLLKVICASLPNQATAPVKDSSYNSQEAL